MHFYPIFPGPKLGQSYLAWDIEAQMLKLVRSPCICICHKTEKKSWIPPILLATLILAINWWMLLMIFLYSEYNKMLESIFEHQSQCANLFFLLLHFLINDASSLDALRKWWIINTNNDKLMPDRTRKTRTMFLCRIENIFMELEMQK